MNSDQLEGKWKQFKGKVKERWGRLTDDDLEVINGRHQQLAGALQERYGIAKETAENEIADFLKTLRETEMELSEDPKKLRRAV